MVGLHFSPRRRPFVRTRTLADVGKAGDEAFERHQTEMGVALLLYYTSNFFEALRFGARFGAVGKFFYREKRLGWKTHMPLNSRVLHLHA